MADETLVIRRPRSIGFLMVASALAFVGLGVIFILEPDQFRRAPAWFISGLGWFSCVFFGASALFWFARMVRPSRIVLSREGFVFSNWPYTLSVRWEQIEAFYLADQGVLKKVAWRLRGEQEAPASLLGPQSGFSWLRDLGVGWDRPPAALLALLEAWRRGERPVAGTQ